MHMTLFPGWNTAEEIERDAPATKQLREYWETLNRGLPPERHRINPEVIKELLPYTLLVEFEADPFRVRYRLTGTKVDEETGYNITGRYLDEFLGEPFKAVREGVSHLHSVYERAWETGRPVIGKYEWSPGPVPLKIPIGIFPVALNGKISQAVAIEQSFKPTPYFEITTWKDHLSIHAEKQPNELEFLSYR